jgi:hypothetical protein
VSPEAAVERVRTFLKWCVDRFEWLGPGHVPLDNPLGYRRNSEFWVTAVRWHDIFDNDEDGLTAARALRDEAAHANWAVTSMRREHQGKN